MGIFASASGCVIADDSRRIGVFGRDSNADSERIRDTNGNPDRAADPDGRRYGKRHAFIGGHCHGDGQRFEPLAGRDLVADATLYAHPDLGHIHSTVRV